MIVLIMIQILYAAMLAITSIIWLIAGLSAYSKGAEISGLSIITIQVPRLVIAYLLCVNFGWVVLLVALGVDIVVGCITKLLSLIVPVEAMALPNVISGALSYVWSAIKAPFTRKQMVLAQAT